MGSRQVLCICISLICFPLCLFCQTITSPDNAKLSPLLYSYIDSLSIEEIQVKILSTQENIFQSPSTAGTSKIISSFLRGNNHIYTCRIPKKLLATFAAEPHIQFIELDRKAYTEFKQEGLDLTINGLTYLRNNDPSLSGTGRTISIKENLFDTSDIDFKKRIGALSLASSYMDIHATNMASIAAGGGNSSPTAKGAAWDATLSSSDFANLFPDADEYFLNENISVQNHSYGTGIENYYGAESKAYDEQAYSLPWLLHVFSAGNIGDQAAPDGKYKGLTGWANITGQFKQSKNTITVGATDSLNHVVSLSSSGPAYDGRIKPEVVAYGHGGSSGAAAMVSGVSLLIQQAFFEMYHQLPFSSLVKAVLINSATDIESPGPDYKSGFGAINADLAVRAIRNYNTTHVTLHSNSVWEMLSDIPENVASVTLTIAWTDPPGEILSSNALVNDIDLEVENLLTGEKWLPWILNSFPASDSISLPATMGRDSLNNFEKITMTFPEPGDYILRIRAHDLNTESQVVSFVVQYDTIGNFEWTYPTKADHLLPGQDNMIRWYSTIADRGNISLRYIGEEWQLIATDLQPSKNQFLLDIGHQHGLAQLMWSSPAAVIFSDTFLITSPLEPEVALLCADSLIINWGSVLPADSFLVFKLGEKHLEEYKAVKDTFLVDQSFTVESPYYAVAPLKNGVQGPLSYAFDFTKQGAGCFLEIFYVRHVLDGKAYFAAELSGINWIEKVILEEMKEGVFTAIRTATGIDSSTLYFESDDLHQGINDFRLHIILSDGREILSQEERVYFNNNDVLVFPNPSRADDDITFLVNGIDEFDILILDMQGKEFARFNELSSPAILSSLNLLPGIYIYKIVSSDGDLHGKFQVY